MNTLKFRDDGRSPFDAPADRLAYLVVTYGLLAIVAFRGLVEREQSWDLLGLVVLGGLAGTAYRVGRGGATRSTMAILVATVLIAGLLAGIIALLRT